jgi:hypothetical protein
MRASAALLITASFSAHWRSAILPSRRISAVEHHALADADASPASTCSSTGYSSSSVTLVRNPSPPRFTARMGTLWPPSARVPKAACRRLPARSADRSFRPVLPAPEPERRGTHCLRFLVDKDGDFPLAAIRISGGTTEDTTSGMGLHTMPTERIITVSVILFYAARLRACRKNSWFPSAPGSLLGFTPTISSPKPVRRPRRRLARPSDAARDRERCRPFRHRASPARIAA